MESLIQLLTHPYLVLNHVAASMYGENTAAAQQRLRSRATGRHRFTVEDYKLLRKEALAVSRRLDRMADKLEAASKEEGAVDWLGIFRHPWLNHRALLQDAGRSHGLDYLGVYDRLRHRGSLPEGLPESLIATCRDFAAWIRAQLEQAREEQKTYVFSQGRGGASHRKE